MRIFYFSYILIHSFSELITWVFGMMVYVYADFSLNASRVSLYLPFVSFTLIPSCSLGLPNFQNSALGSLLIPFFPHGGPFYTDDFSSFL